MRSVVLTSCVALLGLSCSHPQNPERKDSLAEQVTGPIQPNDRVFLKDDPASRVSCRADTDCPLGAMCYPGRHACFTTYPPMDMAKLEVTCPLVPLYFAVDSAELVPEAQRWIDYDAGCLKQRAATHVELKGFADARGDEAYNADLSRRRAEVVRDALAAKGVTINVAVRGEGATDPILHGTTEHDYAYNRRVELKSKSE
jgi:outer membrane protein OmpA-like peptidoglycan-associated protein